MPGTQRPLVRKGLLFFRGVYGKEKKVPGALRVGFLGKARIGLEFSSRISFRGTWIQYSSTITPSAHRRPLTHTVPTLAREQGWMLNRNGWVFMF